MDISRAVKRAAWHLRHRASSYLLMLERGFAVAESIADNNSERLIIIDEVFPSPYTGFLIAEFNAIVRHFPSTIIYSTVPTRREFREYAVLHPELVRHVRRFSSSLRLRGAAAYIVFLNNIAKYVEQLEEARLPFAFELYPGGGLRLGDSISDAKLARVFASPMFRKVIVTQNVTHDYLLRKKLCHQNQIELVFGVVVSANILHEVLVPRLRFGVHKRVLDICFVAHKYLPGGVDKGYDRFVACARILSRKHVEARFHVVGNFTEADADVADFREKITFYGPRPTTFFPRFHAGMDIILSPNVHSAFSPGSFDGFPTGCCIEAGLCGTAMFVSDELKMNSGYLKEDEEIVIISREPDQIAEVVERYIIDPQGLALLAENGQRAVRRLFSLDAQMGPRLRVLSELLAGANRSVNSTEQPKAACSRWLV
jgi:glycosyltransferase involved in cell wall biosynthesis